MRESKGDVTIENVNIKGNVSKSLDDDDLGTKQGASGFVSYVKDGSLTIEDCNNYATITDDSYCAGGFVGRTKAPVTIKNSNNYGKVTSYRPAEGKAAGLIGMPAAETTIENCKNFGDIKVVTKGVAAAGGMVGWFNGKLTIKDCENSANIEATIDGATGISAIGGIYGGNGWGTGDKLISGCKNTGNITVKTTNVNNAAYERGVYAGSIMGATAYDNLTIKDCLAGGKISVTSNGVQSQYISGLAGGLGWNTAITMTDNVIDSSLELSGNQAENTHINALYYNETAPGTPASPVVEDNDNNTSYPDKN